MKYKVYKITNNITGKIYFGYTSQSLSARFNGHYGEPRDTIISRTIRKYGKDHFKMELVEEHNNQEIAKSREIWHILEYQTNIRRFPEGNGMNMTDGGEGCTGYKHTSELKEKWSKERKGVKQSDDVVERRVAKARKAVYVFDLSGQLVSEYQSTQEAGVSLGVDRSNISKCCSNQIKTIAGVICQYSPIFDNRSLEHKKCQMMGGENPHSSPVYAFNVEGEQINYFQSVRELSEYYEMDYRYVIGVVQGKHKILSNGVFVSHDNKFVIHSRVNNKRNEYVVEQVDVDNNVLVNTFGDANSASKFTCIPRGNIHSCLCGRSKTAGGFRWVKKIGAMLT
jgi:predicted GIY-YIG superfamily endonuclease